MLIILFYCSWRAWFCCLYSTETAARKTQVSKTKRGTYNKYTDKRRLIMGSNNKIYGVASTVRIWRKSYPNLNESTLRSLKKRYVSQIKKRSKQNRFPKKVLVKKLCGSPSLLRQPDQHTVSKILESNQIQWRYCKYHSCVSNSKSFSREILTVIKR